MDDKAFAESINRQLESLRFQIEAIRLQIEERSRRGCESEGRNRGCDGWRE